MTVVIKLHHLTVEMYHDEVVLLLVIIEANTYGRYQKRIFFNLSLQKVDVAHYFLAAKRDTLFRYAELVGKLRAEAVYLTASADDKGRRHGSVAV